VASVRKRLVGAGRWVSRAAAAMALGGGLAFGSLTALYPQGVPDGLLAFALGSLLALVASPVVGLAGRVLRIGGLRREGRLLTDERGLVFEHASGRQRVLASSVESGVILPRDGRFEVELVLRSGNVVSARVEDEASAEALLDLVGLGRDHRRTKVRWARLWTRLTSGAAGAFVGLVAGLGLILALPTELGALGGVLFMTLPFLTPAPFSRWLAWRELEVGSDGIAWRYWLRRKLVPLSEVRDVEARDGQLIVRLADGTDRRFEIPRDGLAEGLQRRIEVALAARGRGEGHAALFARGELSFREWVERMQHVLRAGGAFRAAPVGVADAVGVLEDVDADPDARLGAAVALTQTGEAALGQRVRVVAEHCVSPRLRVALERAADGELEEELLVAAREELRLERHD